MIIKMKIIFLDDYLNAYMNKKKQLILYLKKSIKINKI